jgi:hypothetical protein
MSKFSSLISKSVKGLGGEILRLMGVSSSNMKLVILELGGANLRHCIGGDI